MTKIEGKSFSLFDGGIFIYYIKPANWKYLFNEHDGHKVWKLILLDSLEDLKIKII